MPGEFQRNRLLAAVGALGSSALAGCGTAIGDRSLPDDPARSRTDGSTTTTPEGARGDLDPLAWETLTDGDADATVRDPDRGDAGEFALSVHRCSHATAVGFYGDCERVLRVSFEYEVTADGWYE